MASTATAFDCDHCGKPQDEHFARELADKTVHFCWEPEERRTAPMYAETYGGWRDDGHMLTVEISNGGARPVIICPGKPACETKYACFECDGSGRYYNDADDEKDCPSCEGTGIDEDASARGCWISEHVREFGSEVWEYTPWRVPITVLGPMPILWACRGSGEDAEFEWRPKLALASRDSQAPTEEER